MDEEKRRPRGGELAGIRTQDPRLKRALLYQLSYELDQGRFLQANTGDELLPVDGLQRVFTPFSARISVLKWRPFGAFLLGNHTYWINGNHGAWECGYRLVISRIKSIISWRLYDRKVLVQRPCKCYCFAP